MNTRELKLCIGLNDKDTHKQEISTEKAVKIIMEELLKQGIERLHLFNSKWLL